MTNGNTQPDRLRHLPSLDSVEYRLHTSLIAVVLVGLFAVMPIMVAVKSWRYVGDMRLVVILACAIMMMPVIWVLYRCLMDAYYWKTDSLGITQRSPLRRFSVRWDNIQSVDMRTGFLGISYWRISTATNVIAIPAEQELSASSGLIASIRQHMVLNGTSDLSSIPESVLSFWYCVPDELPRQMDWKCTLRVQWASFFLVWVMFLMVAAVIFLDPQGMGNSSIALLAMVCAEAVAVTLYTLKNIPAKVYSICDEYITVTWRSKSLTIPWHRVTKASWKIDPNGTSGIFIRQNDPKIQFLVPYSRKDEDSGRLVLSIIRRLQSAGIYLTIPRSLRVLNPQRVNVPQDGVALHLSRIIRHFTTALLLLMGILPLLPLPTMKSHNNDRYWISAIVFVSFAIWGAFSNIYRVRADETGLHKRTIFGSKTIAWDKAVVYEKVLSDQSERGMSRIKVKDNRGRVIFRIDSSDFAKPDWDTFTAYVDSKLGHLLVHENTKPWLARPYDSGT
ncbi:MAG: hypothetical protein ABFD49_08770 [Armatimonadota bacterium]|nr:hypothetical protein [bacterium]